MKNITAGRRNVIELLKKLKREERSQIKEILIKENIQGEIKKELSGLLSGGMEVRIVPKEYLDEMFPGLNHQGIVCIRKEDSSKAGAKDLSELKVFLDGVKGPFLILDRIQDAGNLGNILRSAECLGFKNIILSERESASITETVERVSSGALHYLNLFSIMNLSQAVGVLKDAGYWIVASSDKGSDDWSKLPEADSIALVVGNEKDGVKKLLLDEADFTVRIAMHGSISSLNVTSASAILMDRIRNRH